MSRENQMAGIEVSIAGSEKLTNIFGYWPSFHDAEVLELHFSRGDVRPSEGKYEFPILRLKIHLWALTKEVDSKGYFVLRNHTLTTLKFTDVGEFEMEGFNHQNAMISLHIERREERRGPSPDTFVVTIQEAFGMGALFKCASIEVVEASPCTPQAQPVTDER
jgi:hypothetical protein